MERSAAVIGPLIEAVARSLGVTPAPTVIDGLVQFAQLFLKWNEKINLASAASSDDLIERHFADSFVASRFVGDSATLADVGSGGGLPSIPLALLRPQLVADLFEPNRKKVAFLRTAIRELGLSARVQLHTDAVASPVREELSRRFDVAMSRATLSPPLWLDLGRELVRPSGSVIVFATGHSEAGLERPFEMVAYARNRRLLLYRALPLALDVTATDVPRGT